MTARLWTKELVMFEFAMECHGTRFRHELHKETLFNATQMQLPDDMRGVHD